jgi:hypothetical protein
MPLYVTNSLNLRGCDLQGCTESVLISPGQFPAFWGGTRAQGLPWGLYYLFHKKTQ